MPVQLGDSLPCLKVAVVVPFYNGGGLVKRVIDALLSQSLPAGYEFEIVAVDDGSDDGSTIGLDAVLGNKGRVLRLTPNMGRCAARNAGALAAKDADLLLFVDGDCVGAAGLVTAHAAACAAGADVSFGDLLVPGHSFWARLQQDAASRRIRHFRAGDAWAFTAANVAIRRDAFVRVGGFDLAFNRHGFEDRDLFARLAAAGFRHVFSSGAVVLHEDAISLASVSRKLGDAGYHAATVFRARHPGIYARMAFSRIDCSLRPWLRWVDRLSWPIARRIGACRDDSWLEWRVIPFAIRALVARTIYGLWFLHGTAGRPRSKPD
jgi:glycosyltransferase involved in cell wall biosynthesis